MSQSSAHPLHPTSKEPEVCHVCGRRAGGIATGAKGDRWLCEECLPLLEYVRNVRRWDVYEVRAIDAVDDATGNFAADHGTDIAAYPDEVRRQLWTLVLRTHQAEIRRQVREGEAPF